MIPSDDHQRMRIQLVDALELALGQLAPMAQQFALHRGVKPAEAKAVAMMDLLNAAQAAWCRGVSLLFPDVDTKVSSSSWCAIRYGIRMK
ncbi:MAG: hypothetical protein AB7U73_01130 [Pirellulales bacterium]